MSTALDEFERILVKASRELYAEGEVASAPPSRNRAPRRPSRWRILRCARQLGVAVQFGLAVSGVFALGGTAAYLFLSGSETKSLASIECNVTRNFSAIVNTITGNPVVDCAAVWPSATGGRAAAPPLSAWALDTGTKVAVVQPTSWGPPAGMPGAAWRRLPADWTVNLNVVELTDQLSDISNKLSGTPMSPDGGPPCTYAERDVRTVRSLLNADGLSSWRIRMTASDRSAAISAGCRVTTPSVEGNARTVLLVQGPVEHVHLTPQDRKLATANGVANYQLAALAKRVNHTLATRCESVNAAAALWTIQARGAGFHPATLAYYRTLNATPNPGVRLDYYYYTLVKQPPTQHTGACAHVLVMRAGGGNLTVYAARIAL